ncbi:pentatricopeptide repeat-containing protein At4g21065 [Selaginella moellendorffii]|uniref:pentatricopeptide repeat-containing protein At4g21065 n=1 Tax=Selaginella moellendorffii TaxID=88036 RepID=UPI000D1C6114|nr:pentatricopeptide repeat-containing protein At4g21065 [Selaginella moellendorffii]|eukprot:XP_002987183.2 pentatricopeptide repeat-containing protein At4g21065 [Selaginella moellendorffii]
MDLEGIASNEITFVAALVACCDCPGSLALGKQIHERIIAGGLGSNVFLANSLVTMYGRSSEVAEAEAVFRSILRRSLTSWNSMLAAYAQNGHSSVALDVHVRMDHEGVASDEFTFVTLLDACAMAGTLQLGRQIHDRTDAMGLMTNGFVATALLDMYGKRGSLGEARAVFDRHCTGSVVAWTAMIASYAQHGRSAEALELYGGMALEGLAPNSVTFVNILSACSYYGMVDQGWEFFASMRGDHGICPEAVHFGCMVDVLSRAGQLDRAEELLESLPPFLTAQLSLLGACQLHGDLQRGWRVSHRVHGECREKYVMLTNLSSTSSYTNHLV